MFDVKKFKKHYPYNNKKVMQQIILCRFSSSESAKSKARLKLFYFMNKIIEKGMMNFFFTLAKLDKKLLHSREDIISEAYIVLDLCVSKYDIRNVSNFYFYYNVSLGRRLIRIIKKEYVKHLLVDNKTEDDYYHPKSTSNEIDFVDFYLENNGFSNDERRIIDSKVSGERVDDFLSRNPDINLTTYYALTRQLKNKLMFLKNDRL